MFTASPLKTWRSTPFSRICWCASCQTPMTLLRASPLAAKVQGSLLPTTGAVATSKTSLQCPGPPTL